MIKYAFAPVFLLAADGRSFAYFMYTWVVAVMVLYLLQFKDLIKPILGVVGLN